MWGSELTVLQVLFVSPRLTVFKVTPFCIFLNKSPRYRINIKEKKSSSCRHLLHNLLLFWKYNTQFVKRITCLRKVKWAKLAKILWNTVAGFYSKKIPPKSQFFVQQSPSTRELMELILKTVYTKKYFMVRLFLISCISVKIKLALNT